MSKFKFDIGDVVKCIDNSNYNGLTVGGYYDVLDTDEELIQILTDWGFESCVYSWRFELVDAHQKSSEPLQPTSDTLHDRNIENDLENRLRACETMLKAKNDYINILEKIIAGGFSGE